MLVTAFFIPLGRLHLKWSLWDVWTHQARIMLTSPRGTQRGLVFILGSIWCSGMITAVSHHSILSCLGCYARATHRCIQGTLLTFLRCDLDASSRFELHPVFPKRLSGQDVPAAPCQWLFSIIVVFPQFLNIICTGTKNYSSLFLHV